eukprot:comp14650_c0_seq1/m.10985 comp14650_c0_seq1/g.10985  ORF comp14650_c0_seq1/g.10985 comp14650_c0_seq1/m.10985 type:complete len:230 (-) comp14650_c0_seq1:239-928(-)
MYACWCVLTPSSPVTKHTLNSYYINMDVRETKIEMEPLEGPISRATSTASNQVFREEGGRGLAPPSLNVGMSGGRSTLDPLGSMPRPRASVRRKDKTPPANFGVEKEVKPPAVFPSVAQNYEEEFDALKNKFSQGKMLAFGPDSVHIFEQMTQLFERQRQLAADHMSLEKETAEKLHKDPPGRASDTTEATISDAFEQQYSSQFHALLDRLGDLSTSIGKLHVNDLQQL